MRLGRFCGLALLVAAVWIAVPPAAVQADPVPEPIPYVEGAAPVYLIISFDDTFIVGRPQPSQTIVVNIGMLEGGGTLEETEFLVNQELSEIPLPEGRKAPTFQDLMDNSATMLGSFQTTDLAVHMVTASPTPVPPEIQYAVYMASNGGHLDSLFAVDPYPTTLEIGDVIMAQMPEGSPYGANDVLSFVFNSGMPLDAGDNGASLVGEGDMFPHEPGSGSIFRFRVEIFQDGSVATDVCGYVGIDVVPNDDGNPVKIIKNGEFPVAFLTTSIFDPVQEIDPLTARIGGVLSVRDAVFDADDDGDDDLVVYFMAHDLYDAGIIDTTTTTLAVHADLYAGGCVLGTDSVVVTRE